jgi:hypothetical protein
MKNFMFCAFIVIVFASCGQNTTVLKNKTPEEKWAIIQANMAPNVSVSAERPLPNVLSEKEILLKATDALAKEGAFDPSRYEYKENPALLAAKIETPILLYRCQ